MRPARREERFWAAVAGTLREAPARTRWGVAALLAAGGLAIAFQLWDSARDQGPWALTEFLSVLLGTGGSLLLGLAYVLFGAAEKAAGCGRKGLFFEPRVLHRMLLALPGLGAAAGVLLAASVGMMVVRALHGRPVLYAAAAIYLGILLLALRAAAVTTRFLYRHAREQAETAARAEAEAGEARLAALQAQMNPHFLFNALNTVASLTRTSPETAETTIENLADVLRRTLARSRHPMGTVGEEIEYLEAYLAVEQERWGERLSVEWHVAPETLDLPLPPMTLQPVVENALRHGLGARIEGGRLTLAAELAGGGLRLTVADDGPGFPRDAAEGTGLGNLRRRLTTLYGEGAVLTVERASPGARVVIELPAAGPRAFDASSGEQTATAGRPG